MRQLASDSARDTTVSPRASRALRLERAIALVALGARVVGGRARHAAAHAVAVLVEPQRAAVAGHAVGHGARQRLADRVGRGAVRELAREVEQHLRARALLGRLLVQDGVLEGQARDVRHHLEQAHVVAVEAALPVARQHDRADGRVLAHERRGEQRRAALVEQQRGAAAHDLQRVRAQLGRARAAGACPTLAIGASPTSSPARAQTAARSCGSVSRSTRSSARATSAGRCAGESVRESVCRWRICSNERRVRATIDGERRAIRRSSANVMRSLPRRLAS